MTHLLDFLPLIESMGLLIVISAMLAHWANYLFLRASTVHLPYFLPLVAHVGLLAFIPTILTH